MQRKAFGWFATSRYRDIPLCLFFFSLCLFFSRKRIRITNWIAVREAAISRVLASLARFLQPQPRVIQFTIISTSFPQMGAAARWVIRYASLFLGFPIPRECNRPATATASYRLFTWNCRVLGGGEERGTVGNSYKAYYKRD